MSSSSTDESYPQWLLYYGFLFNGMSVVLLGPLLPRLSLVWSLSDWQVGALLAAQFLGSSLGSLFVFRRHRIALVGGSISSCLGILAVALHLMISQRTPETLAVLYASLLIYGFGLGQIMTSINLAMGKDAEGRVSRLSLANALWSLGAILSPLLLALFLQRIALGRILILLAAAFLIFLALAEATVVRHRNQTFGRTPTSPSLALPTEPLLLFAALLFLYGGVETCFSGWLTTFAHRSAGVPDTISPICTSAFWVGVASGRALASILLRRLYQRREMYLLCGCTLVCSLGLISVRSMLPLSIVAICCGGFLGPIFPVAFSSLLNLTPSSRQCGFVLTSCGFGASVLPLLLGILSQRLASLRMSLFVPSASLLLMLVIVWLLGRINSSGAAVDFRRAV